ncbi:MAG: hypothetical protein IE878_04985 [Epsilonproteobacteria bacterium]|nr:hypothetical protein [Campylobacterota bacterium]
MYDKSQSLVENKLELETKRLKANGLDILALEPNIETHKDLEMIEYKDTLQQADIATFLVAHKEFKKLDVKTNLDFCGGN